MEKLCGISVETAHDVLSGTGLNLYIPAHVNRFAEVPGNLAWLQWRWNRTERMRAKFEEQKGLTG